MSEAGTPMAVEDRWQALGLRNVTVGGEIGRRIAITVHNNLMRLRLDEEFLAPFRVRNAKVSTYVGLGKVLDSAVRFAAQTGDPEVVDRKDAIVEELLRTQDADGYMGTMPPELRMWYVWDVHEMSYLVRGLTSEYSFFHNERALGAACGLADYMVGRWEQEPGRPIVGEDLSYWLVGTGLEEAMLALHHASGDRRYLDFCLHQRGLADWDEPIVIGRHGRIEGHVYAYLARCLAQQELYRIVGDPALLAPSRRALEFSTQRNGMTISGGCGQDECWDDRQDVTRRLGETCASAHFIYFMDSLLRLEGNPYYGDIMERVIYNALFGAQSPDGRRLRYNVPLEGERRYFDRDGYCCPGNYRRIVADLPRMIAYRVDGGLAVNLYTASTLVTEVQPGLRVRLEQRTDYPSSGRVEIRVDPERPLRFPLRLRIPRWCAGAEVRVNGSPASAPSGAFHTVEREWAAGDSVELHLPMPWRAVRGRAEQAGRAAVMRGPALFCVDPSRLDREQIGPLKEICIDVASIAGPMSDEAVRPGGIACRARGWRPGAGQQGAPDLDLLLRECPDPNAQATYFRVPRAQEGMLVEDELFHG